MFGGCTHLNDGSVAVSDGRIHLLLEVGFVVSADLVLDGPAIGEHEIREESVATIPKILKNT